MKTSPVFFRQSRQKLWLSNVIPFRRPLPLGVDGVLFFFQSLGKLRETISKGVSKNFFESTEGEGEGVGHEKKKTG